MCSEDSILSLTACIAMCALQLQEQGRFDPYRTLVGRTFRGSGQVHVVTRQLNNSTSKATFVSFPTLKLQLFIPPA